MLQGRLLETAGARLAEAVLGMKTEVLAADDYKINLVRTNEQIINSFSFAGCSEITCPAADGWESLFSPALWMRGAVTYTLPAAGPSHTVSACTRKAARDDAVWDQL